MMVLMRVCVAVAVLMVGATAGDPTPAPPTIWAFLVAGSAEYYNYRHQADVCHAYQVLRKNGIPNDNIIVMMADDIAYNSQNPTPGVIVNTPSGPNVYLGVLKDYTGSTVNPENFLNVLKGNGTAMRGIGSGRVINSGPNDIVFVNFVDHGGPGVFFFGEQTLTADVFVDTLEEMASKQKFSKMFLYIEACHAGSMFDDLLKDDLNIFALTASDPFESSYACYYDNKRETYLGDVFSVSWLYDTEHEALTTESVHHQFEKVRTMTNTSHVEEYGDLEIGDLKVSEILGLNMKLQRNNNNKYVAKPMDEISEKDVVSSVDVPLELLNRKLDSELDPKARSALKFRKHHMLKARSMVDRTMSKLISVVSGGNAERRDTISAANMRLGAKNMPCYKKAIDAFSDNCFHIGKNPYVRSHLKKLVNMCAVNWLKTEDILSAILHSCNPAHRALSMRIY